MNRSYWVGKNVGTDTKIGIDTKIDHKIGKKRIFK